MAKKKSLTEAEIFYATEKSKEGISGIDIAATLGVDISLVEPYLKQPPKQRTLTDLAFGRHKRGGVVVGTEAASMHGDNKSPPPDNRDTSRYIAPTGVKKD